MGWKWLHSVSEAKAEESATAAKYYLFTILSDTVATDGFQQIKCLDASMLVSAIVTRGTMFHTLVFGLGWMRHPSGGCLARLAFGREQKTCDVPALSGMPMFRTVEVTGLSESPHCPTNRTNCCAHSPWAVLANPRSFASDPIFF